VEIDNNKQAMPNKGILPELQAITNKIHNLPALVQIID